MLPVMTTNAATADARARLAHHGVRVRLPNGHPAIVYSRLDPVRGRIVIVKPTKE